MDKKPNHMWRMNFVDYEGSTAQCLTCKEFFPSDYNKVYKYCPCCGIELKKEFTKRNKRWYATTWKQHFPYIEIIGLVKKYERESRWFGLSDRPKYTESWEHIDNFMITFNGSHFRKNLFSRIGYASRRVDDPTKLQIKIKTWDGKEKSIVGSELKAICNREYHTIEPPKPMTLSCSGIGSPDFLLNRNLIQSSIFQKIYDSGGM